MNKSLLYLLISGTLLSYAPLSSAQAKNTTGYPGMSLGSQVGYGLNKGSAAVGLGATSDSGNISGAIAGALGIGNAKTLGAQLDMVIVSIDTRDNGFAEDGYFNFKVHKTTRRGLASFALGIENIGQWGDSKNDDSSTYLAASKVVPFSAGKMLILSGGLGNGRFIPFDKTDSVAPFFAASYLPHKRASLIADYTSNITNLGVSFVPSTRMPVTVTVFANDVAEELGSTKAGISVGYSIKY